MSEVTRGQSLQHGLAQSVCGHLPLPNADSILALTDPLEFNHIFHPGPALSVIYPTADGWEDLRQLWTVNFSWHSTYINLINLTSVDYIIFCLVRKCTFILLAVLCIWKMYKLLSAQFSRVPTQISLKAVLYVHEGRAKFSFPGPLIFSSHIPVDGFVYLTWEASTISLFQPWGLGSRDLCVASFWSSLSWVPQAGTLGTCDHIPVGLSLHSNLNDLSGLHTKPQIPMIPFKTVTRNNSSCPRGSMRSNSFL